MLQTVIDRLRLLLGDFRDHLPFLQAIKADPANEVPYRAYADWLERRGDRRARLLRLYVHWGFAANASKAPTALAQARRLLENILVPEEETDPTRGALMAAMRAAPLAWLYHAFGNPGRFRQIRQRIGLAERNQGDTGFGF